MKLEQWSFFVLPTYKIDGYTRSQSSITLNSLSKLVNEIQYSELREEINRAYPLAELNKRIFKSANRFVVNVVYILKDCKCTYFP